MTKTAAAASLNQHQHEVSTDLTESLIMTVTC